MTSRAVALVACLLVGVAAPARAGPWDDFQLIMWHDYDAVRMAGLGRMGFSAVKLRCTGGDISANDVAMRRQAGMPWYVENIATDFYAPYHRWTPGKPVTWLFDEARERRQKSPDDRSVFVRAPGLSDPVWIARVQARLGHLDRISGLPSDVPPAGDRRP